MTLNKEHNYNGYRFNIKVELDTKIEKRIDGKRFHTITLNDMGASNYYKTHEAETHTLESIITLMVLDAEEWVNRRENEHKHPAEIILNHLGFK